MATTKSFQLYINNDNVKQYFSTSGGALNGAVIGGKYITMRSSSTTARFTMNNAGRDVLFPSAAAIAHKVDVWAQTIASLNNSKNTINVAIAGQNAITTERIHTSLTEHTGSVSGSFTKSNTSTVYVVKIANGFHAAGVRDTSITAYFTQYSCAASKAGNGVKNVSVSNAAPYAGETVTFSAELYNGANFDGWYSDEACTQFVSSSLTHSTTAAADLILYAKATIDADIYNCSAVAGENVTSAAVSDNKVIEGGSVTFTATIPSYCVFDGWYTALTGGTKVSGDNPYTVIINSDTTLYARATKKLYTITLNQPEHGSATVSATTAHYDDQVTFTCYPDAGWQLLQWRKHLESGGWIAVSKSNPYVMTIQGNVVISPFLTQINYNIRVGESEDGVASVSASTAHYGDNVVFTFTPNEGVDGNYGWYQDAELTQVVSRENPYVHTVTGNITLYPGVVQQISTGFYIKVSGIFVEANAVYKKVNGVWVQQTDITSIKTELQSGNYKLG